MRLLLFAIGLFFVAVAACAIAYPYVRKFALNNGIIDNPDARKLQREPVPCAGGIAMFVGIFAGLMVQDPFLDIWKVTVIITALLIMLIIGTVDDMNGLSPKIRFAVEILVTYIFISGTELYVADLHGLWGVDQMGRLVAFLFSIFAGVGIINAVNLIDGVDGLSSGLGIFVSLCFAFLFFYVGAKRLFCMSMITAGALVPFFFHNVFGKKSKMFMGDGGTLCLGIMLTIFVYSVFSNGCPCRILADDYGVCLPALVVSLMAIPVADVLRVMTSRVAHGRSPFSADKNHLHHDFVALGFSHLGTTLSEVFFQIIIVLTWFLSFKLGASMEWQLYIVVIEAVVITEGWHLFARHLLKGDSKMLHVIRKIAAHSHYETRGWWQTLNKLADRKY